MEKSQDGKGNRKEGGEIGDEEIDDRGQILRPSPFFSPFFRRPADDGASGAASV